MLVEFVGVALSMDWILITNDTAPLSAYAIVLMPQLSASDWLPQGSSNCELVNLGEKHKNLLKCCPLNARSICNKLQENHKNLLKCCLLNARSICNKLQELHDILYHNNHDIVCITESWLHANTSNSLLDPQCKFNIVRTDREDLVGGGACVFISSCLSSIEIATHSIAGEFELCSIGVIKRTSSSCRIMNVNRAPNCAHKSVESVHSLIEQLQILSRARTHCILAGDFNCPYISWTNLNLIGKVTYPCFYALANCHKLYCF